MSLPVRRAAGGGRQQAVDEHITGPGWSLVLEGVAEATRKAYARGWARAEGIARHLGRTTEPMTPQTVISILGHLETQTDGKGVPPSPGTVGVVLAAIRFRHRAMRDREPDWPVPDSLALTKAYVGYSRRWHSRHTVHQASATTPEVLELMLGVLDRTTVRGKRDAALLLTSWFMAARASEIAALRVEQTSVEPDRLGLYLPYSKTDQRAAGLHISLPRYGIDHLCPTRAVGEWVALLRAGGYTTGPLFPTNRPPDRLKPGGAMSRYAVTHVTRKLAADLGLPGDWTAHSHRRGAATTARARGADIPAIMKLGRWKSPATVMRYIDQSAIDHPLAMLPGGDV